MSVSYFFPPTPILYLTPPVHWRTRLRNAIQKSGKSHRAIAAEAGIDPTTLSRILNGHMEPVFSTVIRLASAVHENVGWLLGERGFSLSKEQEKELQSVIRLLNTTLDQQAPRDPRSNARLVASTDIPHEYVLQGARLTYEAIDDSMSGTGIAKGDVLFVRPSTNREDAHGQIVICRIDGADHVGVLDVRADRIRLLSRNKRYPPIPIRKDSRFELIGIVIGRTGLVT